MTAKTTFNRRDFLRVVSGVGAGLVIGIRWPAAAADEGTAATFAPNAFLRIGVDDAITVLVHKSEMGQGVYTSIPMLLAEELEVEPAKVRVEAAPAGAAYVNPALGQQATGGSSSIRTTFAQLRQAGASAREMLIAAAAQAWGVEKGKCRAESGTVKQVASGKSLRYGDLAAAAAKLPVPADVPLKESKDWKVIGRPVHRLDTPLKVDGSAVFGFDVKVDGMLTAMVARCPVFGGQVKKFDSSAAERVPGVRRVVQISSGVAVVAEGTWAAKKGRDALVIEWDEGPNAGLSSAAIRAAYAKAAEGPGDTARHDGDAVQALAAAAKTVEAIYEVPFLNHATMEPMNATAHVRADGCDIWAPTQGQTRAQTAAAKVTGLPAEKIRIHTTFLGGGFGRRFEVDFVVEAVEASRAVGAPVKVVWTREDDMQHGFYRPTTYNRLAAGLDADGVPVAWTHRIVAPSILAREFGAPPGGPDPMSIEGAANIPYAMANVAVDCVNLDMGVPLGFWRSVGSSHNAFVTECFLDEVAAAGKQDPFELRRKLLANSPRHKAALELAATKAGWGTPCAEGRSRGLAVAESFGSFVAQVAEVTVSEQGEVRVHRVVCAIDCGVVINPDTVEAQMQSGIVYGLTAALRGQITLDRGRVQQGNFDDYPLLRMDEMPVVEVHIVPSTAPPGGVGEPGTPPIAPAVANAIFAATGKRVRRLPISGNDLKKG